MTEPVLIAEAEGMELWEKGKAQFLIRAIDDRWPEFLKKAVAMRREATLNSECPGCGALVFIADELGSGHTMVAAASEVILGAMEHDNGCPALHAPRWVADWERKHGK